MKIILVQPPLTLEERYGIKHQSGEKRYLWDFLYLASSARADGYSVKIIDAEILGLEHQSGDGKNTF